MPRPEMTPAVRISKKMSYLLRHSDKLQMDQEGYALLDDVLHHLPPGTTVADVELVVRDNEKQVTRDQ